ncbi:hypothetical protein GVN20_23325, partial [Runella sp. CRIBMP]|uniref:SdrD B-like domain-containing protein n=1 Tax=Runella sp. CRIBMP TaxID=2683261 RepID=UPI0014132881
MSNFISLSKNFRGLFSVRQTVCAVLFLMLMLSLMSVQAQVTGSVFRDYNGNGTKDTNEPLVSGITVNAYSANSASTCGTAVTTGSTAPNYTLTGCGTAAVRVEFVLPSTGLCANSGIDFASFAGTGNATSIQFVNGNSTNVNFAIHNPSDYNTGTTGVNAFIPCYISGDPLVSGAVADADWFVGYPYTNTGPVGTGTGAGTEPSQKVNGAIIGPTWGVAYSKQAKKVFTSALLKRHVGLGKLGSGGIYMLEPTATSFNVTEFYDMDANGHRTRALATAPAYGSGTSYSIAADNSTITYLGTPNDPLTGKPSGLGVIGTNAQRGLTANPLDPSYDPAAFDQVGKVGIGDIDISDDGKYLFVMNLYSRKVFRLELNNAYNPTSVVAVTSYDVPDPACTNGTYRPWGLKFFRNKLYVGVICSGEDGGAVADLSASVFELNNPTAAAAFNTTAVVTLPLTYDKENDPKPWTNNSNPFSTTQEAQRYGTPLLSDIEFTDNGDMVLGFMDRSGHQWGEENRRYLKTATTSVTISTSGDILAAGLNCSTGAFTLENNGTFTSANGSVLVGSSTLTPEGPGGKEFFNDNSVAGDPHRESSTGALAVLKGQGEVMSTAFAQNKNSGDAGTMTLSTTDGSFNDYYQLYYRGNPDGIFAKANGLGDIELSGIEAPIEIGNRIWKDTDKDGIQDAGEDGVDGVEIELYEGTTATGSPVQTVTSATLNGQKGSWFFTNLKANQDYVIKVKTALGAGALATCTAFSPTGAGTTLIDNNTSTGTITLKTGNAGENNHSFDIGVNEAPVCVKPNAGTDQSPTCVGNTAITSATLAATAVAGGAWTQVGNTPNTATITNSSSATSTVTGLVPGVYQFIWATSATCSDTVEITIPNCACVKPNAGTDQSPTCVGNTAITSATLAAT